MNISIGHFNLDIDVNRTREFYKTQAHIMENCDCASCRNYAQAVTRLPEAVQELFDNLGVDINQEAEVMIPYKLEDGRLIYSAFYHLVGKIISCVTPHESTKISDDCCVWFSAEGDLVPKEFPQPVVQLFFDAKLPWLLDEECSY